MLLGSELIHKNITNRNLTKVRSLGVDRCGEYQFAAQDLFDAGVRFDYSCKCDKCGSLYRLCWTHYQQGGYEDRDIKWCQTCRHYFAQEKMTVTKRTAKFRQEQSKRSIDQLSDPVIIAARQEGARKRKEGWCQTDEAKQVSIGNLKHRFGEDHHNWNPNKDEYLEYKRQVRLAQSNWDLNLVPEYDESKRALCGVDNGYQLDHIISQKYGFDHSIDPYYIGHVCNLQFLTWEENRAKHHNNTEEELQDMINTINKIDQCVYFEEN